MRPTRGPWLAHTAEPYAFLPSEGEGLHQIAVGPVHAGIIEPGHFRFTANGEHVVRLEQRLGYVHKGIEKLMCRAPRSTTPRNSPAAPPATARWPMPSPSRRPPKPRCRIEPPPRAIYLRALMAELERLANHFGDIGAICNDASFAMMHAQTGILRERTLRAAEACFGHRLMMDVIVPGGVARDIAAGGRRTSPILLAEIRRVFPRLIELYDNTASLQDRTVTTGIVSPDYARQFGAGGYVGRASGRAFDARRTPGYAPYDDLTFDVPVLNAGDVNARVWIRIREVEQSLALIDQILSTPAGRKIQTAVEPNGKALRRPRLWSKPSAATCWSGCGSTAKAASRAATCAMRPGSSGRCWKPRSKATSSPTSRSATNRSTARIRGMILNLMRKVLFESFTQPPLTEPAPKPDEAGLAELAQSVNRAARARLGRSLSIRHVDAGSCNGCELEIHALSNAFYDLERFGLRFVASPRHADVLTVTGPVTKNMREALLSAPTTPRPTRNGWWRSAPAPSTAGCSPAATRSPAASRTWCRSTCTFPAARRASPPSACTNTARSGPSAT